MIRSSAHDIVIFVQASFRLISMPRTIPLLGSKFKPTRKVSAHNEILFCILITQGGWKEKVTADLNQQTYHM